MAATERMGLTKILLTFYLVNIISGFNVDIKTPYVMDSGETNSFFGYSLAFHKGSKSIIIGAPLSKKGPKGSGGTIFTCEYNDFKTCTVSDRVDSITSAGEIRNDQWMGATVYSDNSKILACAPRYMTSGPNNERWLHGKCDDIFLLDSSEDFVWKPCVNPTKRFDKQFGYCQAGFSAQLFGDGTSYALMSGTPNVQLNIGRLAVAKEDGRATGFTPNTKLNNSEYMGYAVTSGYFSQNKDTIIGVGGSPRANLLKGKVILYDITTKTFPFFSIINDPSKPYQTGTYFGSSMAAADINNDDYTDLVIGAPYYAGTLPNEGAVYVYVNDQGKSLKLAQSLYGDKESGALFGLGIGSVGDLNMDGYSDIAIGAPWGGKDKKGVVYLYYGSANAKPLKLMQKITAQDMKSQLDGFGYSFASYYPYKLKNDIDDNVLNDVDANGYPDLAIGAYRSSKAVVLRSRPVVTIIATLDLGGTKKIDLFSPASMCEAQDKKMYKCIPEVKFCFTLAGLNIGGGGGDVTYALEVDAEQKAGKRGFMYQKNKVVTTVKSVVNVPSPRICLNQKIYILNNTNDVFREFVVKLSWNYQTPPTCPKNICPIANQLVPLLTKARIPFVKGCSSDGNDVCNSDLTLKLSKRLDGGSNTINVGITQVVYIDAEIENKKENAFLNKLLVVYPEELIPNNVVIQNFLGTPIWYTDTTQESNEKTLAISLTSPISPSQVEKINIEFGVLTVGKGTKQINLTATVKTESEEMVPSDNVDTVTIDVSLLANLTISGNVLPDQVKWDEEITDKMIIGPEITHTFFFKNRGPSNADTSEVLVDFPETFNGHYILNINSVTLDGAEGEGEAGKCVATGQLNPLGLNISKSQLPDTNSTKLRKRRDTEGVESLSCGGGVGCKKITCTLNQLKRNMGVTMVITSTLVEATFEQFVKDSKEVKVTAKFTSGAVDKPHNAPPDTLTVGFTVNSPHLTKEKEGDPIAWWIILLCILAAVLIIALIVFIMWKKGFFKRKRAGEEGDALRNGDQDDM